MPRRTPHSGKQKKLQLQAERRRREAGPDEEETAAQEAFVRAYHVDGCGFRWRRSAQDEDAVLVGMVVQRARGGGVAVRLNMRPTSRAAAAAVAVDPAHQAIKLLKDRCRRCDSKLSGLSARFKPSEVGGQRWRHEASRTTPSAFKAPRVATRSGQSPLVECGYALHTSSSSD